jgi:hypothetical protein
MGPSLSNDFTSYGDNIVEWHRLLDLVAEGIAIRQELGAGPPTPRSTAWIPGTKH